MFFEDPGRRYPHLVQALNVLGRRSFGVANQPVPFRILYFAGGMGAVVAAIAQSPQFLLGTITAAVAVGFGLMRIRKPAPLTQTEVRAIEATMVAQSMGEMLSKRRLHRDIDQGSLTLLDECARHWSRARAALAGPFWTAGNVPLHYQAVRSQALTSLDESMDEVLLHYRAWVPDEVQNRHALDYVDEALEQFTFKGARRADFPPPAFAPVREIAEKLRTLADEAERMAREVRVDPEIAAQFAPGRSLDQTLSELRQIRDAEEELRQNLRG